GGRNSGLERLQEVEKRTRIAAHQRDHSPQHRNRNSDPPHPCQSSRGHPLPPPSLIRVPTYLVAPVGASPAKPRSTSAQKLRMNQNARLAATIDTSNPISVLSMDRKPTGFLNQEHRISQTTTGTTSRAIKHPAGLACQERPK